MITNQQNKQTAILENQHLHTNVFYLNIKAKLSWTYNACYIHTYIYTKQVKQKEIKLKDEKTNRENRKINRKRSQ